MADVSDGALFHAYSARDDAGWAAQRIRRDLGKMIGVAAPHG
jgi:hypothetical protein